MNVGLRMSRLLRSPTGCAMIFISLFMTQTAACLAKKTIRSVAFGKARAACSGQRAAYTCKPTGGHAAKRAHSKPASGKPDDREAAGGQFHIFDKMFAKNVCEIC